MSIQLLSVSRRFGSQLALDGVSLNVRTGDCYGFIGHNGAGKTTAMRIALGLDTRFTGQVLIDGFDAGRHPREARARLGGLVEVPGFHGSLDGARNLELLARLQGLSRAEATLEAARVLELVGLSDVGHKPVVAYSHGMRQRLGIAQALLASPACVLLDEPTNGLDPQGIAEMRTLLRKLTREQGLTVMLSSHQLAQLTGLCNRIGVLHRGRLLVEEETERLLGGSEGRYLLQSPSASDASDAVRALEQLAVRHQPESGGGILVQLAQRAPEAVLSALVAKGVRIRAFAPHPATLEEIYLRYAEAGAAPPPGEDSASRPTAPSPAPVSRPAEMRAPAWPIARVVRYELSRCWSRGGLTLVLGLPALLAMLRVWRRFEQTRLLPDEIEHGELFSTTAVTAFEGIGAGLKAALPLAGVILAGLASQSIAGELSRGTLRNLLLRPVRRVQAATGKVLAQLALAVSTYLLLAGAAIAASAWFFDFTGLYEILPDGQRYEHLPASALWPELGRALGSPLLPLAAFVSLGFLAGALARGAAGALALALGFVALLDLARAVARGFEWEGWLPTAYLPSPLGDTSYLAFYSDVAQGVSNASPEYASTQVLVPAIWTACSLALATWILSRRSIP